MILKNEPMIWKTVRYEYFLRSSVDYEFIKNP